jgi:hypothetical protein
MIYTDNGFEADADSYESGVSVDDDAFGQGMDGNDGSESSALLWYVFLALFILVVIMSITIKYCIKADPKTEEVHHES